MQLFSIELARNDTFCITKPSVLVFVSRATRERSFDAICNRASERRRAFCDSLFFVGAFYPFLSEKKTSSFEGFEIFG